MSRTLPFHGSKASASLAWGTNFIIEHEEESNPLVSGTRNSRGSTGVFDHFNQARGRK